MNILRTIADRTLQTLFLIIVISILSFIGIYAIGDPVYLLVDPNLGEAARLSAVQALGLDQPLWRQYLTFVSDLARGQFGVSFVYNISAIEIITQRLPATIELAVLAIIIAATIGIPLGFMAGRNPRRASSKAILAVSSVGFSMPAFAFGVLLIYLFSVQAGWFPSGGRGPTTEILGGRWSFTTVTGWYHLILPAINLSLYPMSIFIRVSAANTADVGRSNFVRFARAQGIREHRISRVFILPNVLLSIVTIGFVEFGNILIFAVLTETVFGWPGIGSLIIESIHRLDRPVVVGFLIFAVIAFSLLNLIADVLSAVFDPRTRGGSLKGGQ